MKTKRKLTSPAASGVPIRIREIVLFTGITLLVSVFSIVFHLQIAEKRHQNLIAKADTMVCSNSFSIIREKEKRLIRPLYLVDVSSESPKYTDLKQQLANTILAYEKRGALISASVYYRNLKDASWMSINGNESFIPDQNSSVPVLISYLKLEEKNPGSLNRTLYFNAADRSSDIPENGITPGTCYSVRVLLEKMILYSDQNASGLLRKNLHPTLLHALFSELQVTPELVGDGFAFSAKDYSKFFRVLFSSTYIEQTLAEYALNLFVRAERNNILPTPSSGNLTIAGTRVENRLTGKIEVTQSAIVYKKESPYLLTIMTRGANEEKQEALIREISGTVLKSSGAE